MQSNNDWFYRLNFLSTFHLRYLSQLFPYLSLTFSLRNLYLSHWEVEISMINRINIPWTFRSACSLWIFESKFWAACVSLTFIQNNNSSPQQYVLLCLTHDIHHPLEPLHDNPFSFYYCVWVLIDQSDKHRPQRWESSAQLL